MKDLATGYGLIEGPVWHQDLGLLYSDVPNGGVFRLAKDGSVSQQVPVSYTHLRAHETR